MSPAPEPAPEPAPGRRWGVLIGITAVVVAVLVVVALVLTTIGKDAADQASNADGSSTASLAHRWTGDGVSIDLPEGWTAGAGVEGLPDMFQQAFAAQPEIGDSMRLAGHGGVSQILMIVAAPKTPGMPASAMTDQFVAGLTGASEAEVTSREATTVAGQPATRIEFSGVNALIGVLAFTWEDGPNDWVAIWIVPTTDLDRLGSTFDAAMHSVSISGT